MKLLLALAASLLSLSSFAAAQTIAPTQAPPSGAIAAVGGSPGSVIVNTFMEFDPMGVKGAPYSADVVGETERVLADGNRIHQETHGKVFRDSEGRTRNEDEIVLPSGQSMKHVSIFDPVENVMIMLTANTKTAHVAHRTPFGASSAMKPQVTPPPPQAERKRLVITTEKLEPKQIEGFNVTGVRRTQTVEAGQIGNDKPVVTVTESWFSPDLKTTLLTIKDDPLSGKTTRKVVNIQTGEPDSQLFRVPPDYNVTENYPK